MMMADAHAEFSPALQRTSGPAFPFVYFLLGQIAFISLWIVQGDVIYLLPFIFALLLLYFSLASLHVWVLLAIVGHAALFIQKTEGVSSSELAFAAFFFGVLSLWLFDRILIQGKKLSVHKGDVAFALFLSLTVFSIVPALAGGNKLLLWLRELLVFLGFLLYYPLREVLRDRRGRIIVYASFAVLALAIAIKNLVQYRSGAAAAVYLWELLGARQTANEPLFAAMVVAGIAVWMCTSRWLVQLFCLILVSFFSLALVLTFSRAYWVSVILGALVLMFLARKEERTRLVQLGVIVVLSALAIIVVFFYDIFVALFSLIYYRFFTAATAAADRSFTNRIAESVTVLNLIGSNPIVGAGLGAEYKHYHLLRQSTQLTPYVHNAYLYLWFKLGILGLVTFITAFLAKIRLGINIAWKDKAGAQRPFVLASIAILISMLQVSITSPQFYARDSVLIICICWATIAAAVEAARD